MLLVAQAAFLCSTRRLCLFPLRRSNQRLLDYLRQLLQTILAVAFLIAVALGCQNQLAGIGDAAALLSDETVLGFDWQRCVGVHVPAQQGLAVDLVDVLPARTAGAGELPG